MGETFRIWAVGCTHAGNDIKHGRESLLEACKDAEKFGFDIGVHLGDFSGQQDLPTDEEGLMYRDQLTRGLKNHLPEDIYPLAGNHDRLAEGGVASLEWFDKYMDPLCYRPETSGMRGENRRYPVTKGDHSAYEVRVGGLSLVMVSDVNRPLTPERGGGDGDPAGVVTKGRYDWWKALCEGYRDTDQSVITFAHYLPKDTTTATNEYGGGKLVDGRYISKFHDAGKENGRYSSYLAYVDETPGRPFIEHLEQHNGDCQLWVGAHNHVRSGVSIGGMGHIEKRADCWFVQNGAATKFHHKDPWHCNPKSRVYEFESGSDIVKITALFHANVNGFVRGPHTTREFKLSKVVGL